MSIRDSASRISEACAAFLLASAIVVTQVLIGGTRLLFSLPGYGLLALAGLLALFSLGRAKPKPDQLCLAGAAVFFSYVLARAIFSPVSYTARADIYSVLGALLVYFLVACVLTGAKQRLFVLLCLFVTAMVQVVIGAIQFRDGDNFMLISFLQRFDYGRRASGFYVCPNHFAGMLEVLGIFGLSIVCWSRWPAWAKLMIGYATATCYAGLILTGSRGSYLSAITSLVILTALSLTMLIRASAKIFLRIGGPLIITATMICVAAFFSIHQSNFLSSRADNILGEDLTDPSAMVRTQLWEAALKQWHLQPFLGTGGGTYLYYGRQFRADLVAADPVYAHNDYLQLLAEYGLVGAAGFVLFLALHLRRGWKSFQRLGPKRVLASVSPSFLSNGLALNIGALASVAAYVVHSIVDFNLHIPANALLLAFVFGVLANPGMPRGDDPRRPKASVLLWSLALPMLGIIVATQCARLLPGEYFAERARTTLRDGDLAASALFARQGLAHERSNPNLYYYAGCALALQGQAASDPLESASLYQSASEELEKAHALARQDKTFTLALGAVYDALGRFPEAEWMYDEAIALDPKSSWIGRIYQMHLEEWRKVR